MAAGETAGKVTIDHHSPVPKYSQLREILLDLVETELDEDQSIPSERELSARFGLSRMTVRQAVDHLVSEGRLYRVQGKGTFLAMPSTSSLTQPVTIQIQNSNGICWQSVFSAPPTVQSPTQFKDRAD